MKNLIILIIIGLNLTACGQNIGTDLNVDDSIIIVETELQGCTGTIINTDINSDVYKIQLDSCLVDDYISIILVHKDIIELN